MPCRGLPPALFLSDLLWNAAKVSAGALLSSSPPAAATCMIRRDPKRKRQSTPPTPRRESDAGPAADKMKLDVKVCLPARRHCPLLTQHRPHSAAAYVEFARLKCETIRKFRA